MISYAPVLIPTLNRYEHFRRCVESLSRCAHANQTELVVGLDYPPSEKYVEGWKKISEYIPTIVGFREVTVFRRNTNYGPERNSEDIMNYCYSKYDRIIFTEDDNEFSPCFLDYMNKALEKYKDDNRVFSVSGYVQSRYRNISDKNVLFLLLGNAWGMGLWKKKEELYKEKMDNIFGDILFSFRNSYKVYKGMPFRLLGAMDCYINNYNYGDYKRGCVCSLYDMLQLQPANSLVRNWGQDGSGLHSSVNLEIMREEISDSYLFELQDVPVVMRPDMAKILWMTRLPEERIRRYYALVRIVLKYLLFRIKYRNNAKFK